MFDIYLKKSNNKGKLYRVNGIESHISMQFSLRYFSHKIKYVINYIKKR